MKYLVVIVLLVSCLGCSDEDVVDPHLLKTIDIPKGSVDGLRICVSPEGSRFASGIGEAGYEMNIWNCEGFIERTFDKREDNLLTLEFRPEFPITGIVFKPDWGSFLSFQRESYRQQALSIWELGWPGGRRYLADPPDRGVDLVIFDAKGERLAYADYQGTDDKTGFATTRVTIRSGEGYRESVTLETPGGTVALMDFSGDRLVASGGGLYIWDLDTAKIIFRDDNWAPTTDSNILMASPDGKQFIVFSRLSESKSIEIRNGEDGSLVKKISGYNPIALSRDWRWFATTAMNKSNNDLTDIRIHDMENGDIEFTLIGHTGHIGDVDFSADGSRLVSVASDRTFKIWDLTK
jgi:WD40 repeat protein